MKENIITKINELTKDYETLSKEIEGITTDTPVEINVLNLRKEKYINERDLFAREYPNKTAVIEEYNKAINSIEMEVNKLSNITVEEKNRVNDVVFNYRKKLDTKINEIESLVRELEKKSRKYKFDINEWHISNKSLDSKYFSLMERSKNNDSRITELKKLIENYKALDNNLKNYLDKLYSLSSTYEQNQYEQIEEVEENIIEDINKNINEAEKLQNNEQLNNGIDELSNKEKETVVSDFDDIKEENIKSNKKYEYEINEQATMQNYKNSGYGQNAYGWYFSPYHDEYIEGYNPLEDDLFQAFNVYEIADVLDEQATMQNYKNSGYGQNVYGWYFSPSHDEYIEGYNPLEDESFQEFKSEKRFIGVKNANEIKEKDALEEASKKAEDIITDAEDKLEEDNKTSEDNKEDIDEKKYDYSYEEAIEILKNSLDAELTDEEIEETLSKIDKFFMQLYKTEETAFENELNNVKGVGNKLRLVEKREERLKEYEKIYDHSNEEIKTLLKTRKESTLNKVNEMYKEQKNQGDYCWKEFEAIKSAMNYIVVCLSNNKEAITEFNSLIKEMQELIKNPTSEKYEEWQNKMNDFTQKNELDYNQLSIYFTAEAKELNKDLSVDNEYNINGLNIVKKHEEVKEQNKKRRKVTAFQKIKKWAKEHKLVCIALGLALAGGALMLIPQTHMMINSALWLVGKKLGFSASSLTALNGINQALVKSVAGGKYAFHAASGLYTLGGVGGAKALYNAGGAKLVGALEGLLVGGAVGTGLTATVKAIVNKIKKRKEEKKLNEIHDLETNQDISMLEENVRSK